MAVSSYGLIQVYYGDNKGKTTAAVGQAVRALGAGANVCMAFFLKPEKIHSSEWSVLKNIDACTLIFAEYSHPMFYKNIDTVRLQEIRDSHNGMLMNIQKMMQEVHYDVVVLDEILNCWNENQKKTIITEQQLITLCDEKPLHTELIMTGRPLPPVLHEKADLITEMKKHKHPFDNGIPARKGIEW